MGPFGVEITPSQKFELRATTGEPVTFEAGTPVRAAATYIAKNRTIELELGGQIVAFKKAKFEKKTGRLVALPEKTGQDIGISVARSLVCNPDCEARETTVSLERCTYYEQERHTSCYTTRYGRLICSDSWISIPRSGLRRMEYATVTRNYTVDARLVDRSWIELASAAGQYTDRFQEVRALTVCR